MKHKSSLENDFIDGFKFSVEFLLFPWDDVVEAFKCATREHTGYHWWANSVQPREGFDDGVVLLSMCQDCQDCIDTNSILMSPSLSPVLQSLLSSINIEIQS